MDVQRRHLVAGRSSLHTAAVMEGQLLNCPSLWQEQPSVTPMLTAPESLRIFSPSATLSSDDVQILETGFKTPEGKCTYPTFLPSCPMYKVAKTVNTVVFTKVQGFLTFFLGLLISFFLLCKNFKTCQG